MKKRMLAMAMAASLVLQSVYATPIFAQMKGMVRLAEADTEWFAGAVELTLGEGVEVIPEDGKEWIYKITPEENGVYNFYTEGYSDTYGRLSDADGELLSSGQDISDEDYNFFIECYLEAEKTYYLETGCYDETEYTVMAEKSDKTFIVNAVNDYLYMEMGDSSELEVVAEVGEELSYQWCYVDAETEELVPIDEANESIYEVTCDENVNEQYVCVVSDGTSTQNIYFTIEVDSGLTIFSEDDYEIPLAPEETKTLTVTAEGGVGELSYQWYYYDYEAEDYIEIEDATSNTFDVVGMKDMQNKYYCKVSDKFMSDAVSFYAYLETGLEVSQSEEDVVVNYGEKVTLSVTAEGGMGDITYQWYYVDEELWEEVAIEGATGSTYEVEGNAELKEAYFCEVKDAYVSEYCIFFTSVETGLEVEQSEKDVTVQYGEKETLSVTATGGAEEITYQWYYYDEYEWEYVPIEGATTNSLEVTGDTELKSEYYCEVSDSVVTVRKWFYTALDTGLDIGEVEAEVDVPYQEKITLSATATGGAGELSYQWYYYDWEEDEYIIMEDATSDSIEVTGDTDLKESYMCKISDGVVTYTKYFYTSLYTGLTIDKDYEKFYVESGEILNFTVNATQGAGELSYQWYQRDDDYELVPISGATSNTYQIIADANASKYYECIVTDGVLTKTASFRVNLIKLIDYTLEDTVEVECGSLYNIEMETGERVVYKFTAQTDGWYTISSEGSCDPYIELYDEEFNYLDDSDDENEMNFMLTSKFEAGKTYYAFVSVYDNNCSKTFTITSAPAAFGAQAKTSVIEVQKGRTAKLEVEAYTQAGELTYKWYEFDWYGEGLVEIKDATTSTYEFVAKEDGEYMCEVSNGKEEERIWFFVGVTKKIPNISLDCTVELGTTTYDYDGTEKKPAIVVKEGEVTLVEGTDYTVSYTDNTKVGTATVTIEGKGKYEGTVTKTFTINAASIAKADVTLAQSEYTYDGKAKTPVVTVKSGNKTLVNGTDYTVSYKDNTKAGTATVTVTAKGNYTGTVTKTFTIKAPVVNNNKTDDNKENGVKAGKTYVVGSYIYKVTGKDTVAFAGITSKNVKKVTIAKTVQIEGKTFKITSIANKALANQKTVKSVKIGANVTKIGKKAFQGCKKLKTITIKSKKLKSVGKNALKGINKKAKIKVPAKKLKAYKQILKGKGQPKKVKINK